MDSPQGLQSVGVRQVLPRRTAQVHFSDGRTFEAPAGTPLCAYVRGAFPDRRALEPTASPIVAALVNGDLEELTYRVTMDVDVTPLDLSTNDGMLIYQRSISFVLIVAVHELFPEARVVIDHSMALGGFFCEIEGRAPFAPAEVEAISRRMRTIVEADEPIAKERISVEEARTIFGLQGYDDKVHLLAYTEQQSLPVYSLRAVRDYFYGYMACSTGDLRWFSLELYPPGLILRLPQRQDPVRLPPRREYPKLTAVFREYGQWLNILGMEDMGSLNEAIAKGHTREAILVAEALHEKRISDIADGIAARASNTRLVLVSGPSASGKTTFTRRLAIQLMVNGLKPYALGLDDYFVDREHTPRDARGGLDYEALEAIDLRLFNQHIVALMKGQTVRLPRYNFMTGKRQAGERVTLGPDAIIIAEGIHGLNPKLVHSVEPVGVYRIYVSALTQLNIDHHNRVPTTDTRLLRRIVRDARVRGYQARETIVRWQSVRAGEERNIFPFQENADVMFNSALAYELAVLKPCAEPLLLRTPRGTMESIEARRLLAFLQWVRACPSEGVPGNSLLREFVGGSILGEG